MISETLPNAISLPALEDGGTPCDSRDGQTMFLFGQDLALASRSVVREKAPDSQTNATSGRNSTASYASARLSEYLANKLQAKTRSLGSTLFQMTWRPAVTPSGRSLFRLAVSGLRTSDSACGSLPTPTLHDTHVRGNTTADGHYYPHDLSNAALLAATPTVRDHKDGATNLDNTPINSLLGRQVLLASIPTPRKESCEAGNPERANDMKARLEYTVFMANVATPRVSSGNTRPNKKGGQTLTDQVRLMDSGETPNGSSAQTERRGQLNPAYSRWLMGYPPEWCACVVTAMQSFRKSPRSSSKPT